jgi:hypothetical protein
MATLEMLEAVTLLFSLVLPGLAVYLLSKPSDNKVFEAVVFSVSSSVALLPLVALMSDLIESTFRFSSYFRGRDLLLWLIFLIPSLIVIILRRGTLRTISTRLSRVEIYSILLGVAYVLLYVPYFLKYPIFPPMDTTDPLFHVDRTVRVSQLGWIAIRDYYPIGLHFFTSFVMTHTGLDPLNAVRYTAVFIDLLTLLVVFLLASKLFGYQIGLAALLAYGFLISPGVAHFFWIGTYANMFGNLYAVLIMYTIYRSLEGKAQNYALILLLVLLGPLSFFAHLSSFLLLVFLWIAIPFMLYSSKAFATRYARRIVAVSAMLPLGMVALPGAFNYLYNIILFSQTYPTSPPLGAYLLIFNMNRFVGPFALVAMLVSALYVAVVAMVKRKVPWQLLFALWFFSSLIMGVESDAPDRFALYSLLPGSLILGIGFAQFVKALGKAFPRTERIRKIMVALALLILIAFSPTVAMMKDSFSNSDASQRQEAIYDSMRWLQSNTKASEIVLSVDITEYRYLPYVANRTLRENVQGDLSATAAADLMKSTNSTLLVTDPSSQMVHALKLSHHFEWVYGNQFVVIFRFHV